MTRLAMDPALVDHWQRWEGYVLGAKGVADRLHEAIAYDDAVAAAGRVDLVGHRTQDLLDRFFGADHPMRAIVGEVCDEEPVNHLGVQVATPLDVWIDREYRAAASGSVDLVGVKRFTASAAFQERVGAFVEMAQVWERIDGQVIELELFDIHRPFRLGGPSDTMAGLLAHDDIWHYGVRIDSAESVHELHARFIELTAADPNYRLRTVDTVANRWHGSVHTKLTNVSEGLEIEFLSYRVDWERP